MSTAVAQVDHDWAVNQRVRWYRSPLPISLLRELSRRSNLRPFLFVTGYLALLAVTGAGVFLVHLHLSWPWLLLALFVVHLFFTDPEARLRFSFVYFGIALGLAAMDWRRVKLLLREEPHELE